MPPRKPHGVDIRKKADGSISYCIRWRMGGGRSGEWASHAFERRGDAIDALRPIELAGWYCYCPKRCPPGAEPGQYGAQGKAAQLTWGIYAKQQIANRTGIGAYYRSRFERELDLHAAELLPLAFEEITRDRVQRWLRGLEGRGLSPATVRRLAVQFGSVQRAAIEAGLATSNPFARHRTGRRDRDQHQEMVRLAPQECERLKAALPAGTYQILATLLIGTGVDGLDGVRWPLGG
jgi:hypothetical protein